MRFDEISDEFLYIFFQITFCLTIWFLLKQLDNSPSLSMSDTQLHTHTHAHTHTHIHTYIHP